ncbi:MAG: hypothetical protein NZ866_02070 [Patescibacteria group bacterium]|nr:hypothetical protein [Patescibacteria group bacterium]
MNSSGSNRLVSNQDPTEIWGGRHRNYHVLNLKNFKYFEYYNKHNFIDYKEENLLKEIFWGMRLDSPNTNMQPNIWLTYRQYSSENEVRFYLIYNMYRKIVEKLKFTGKKVFTNFGYDSTFNYDDNLRLRGTFYSFDKFLDGYMDEGFLI